MKANYTLLTTFIIVTIFFLRSEAQNSYTFTRIPPGTIQYQELFQDSDVTVFADSAGYFDINVLAGEAFQIYNRQNIIGTNAGLFLGDNGFLEIDNYTDSVFAIFDAGFTQLSTLDSTSKMSYQITGTSGNLIVKLQFKNWKLTSGPAGNYANYQIWLYQQTGVVEYHYGGRSANNVSGYTVSNGPNVGTFLAPFDFSACIEKLWCRGNPNNPTLDSVANFQFLAMQGLPDSGTVYRFTPQFFVGIDEQNIIQPVLNVFPALATNTISIEIKSEANPDHQMLILEAAGRTVKSIQVVSGLNEMNISDLKEGMYFVSIYLNGNSFVKKFIKTN